MVEPQSIADGDAGTTQRGIGAQASDSHLAERRVACEGRPQRARDRRVDGARPVRQREKVQRADAQREADEDEFHVVTDNKGFMGFPVRTAGGSGASWTGTTIKRSR